MRYKIKRLPKIGELRTVRTFLLWPITLRKTMGEDREMRWLEWAYITQKHGLIYWENHSWASEVELVA